MTVKVNLQSKYHDGKIRQNRKEKNFYKGIIGVALNNEGRLVKVVDVRFYGINTIHCCVWINDAEGDRYFNGGARATGSGYHKESAAFAEALLNAGIENTGIDGVGDGAVTNAIFEIMSQLGYKERTEVFNVEG